MNLQHERIATLCTKLKLERVATEWTPLSQEAARNETSYAEFLERLLKARTTRAVSGSVRCC
jgi:hypothetical protein